VVETLAKFCQTKQIFGGFFTGLGAVENPILAHYSVPTKKYSKQTLNGAFELTNITGSIGVEKELIVHAHVTLSDEKMNAYGGHLVEAMVGGTVEIILFPTSTLSKKLNNETGLKLFHLAAKM
jgi:predicted DNA-binding protein with PD1-like motif